MIVKRKFIFSKGLITRHLSLALLMIIMVTSFSSMAFSKGHRLDNTTQVAIRSIGDQLSIIDNQLEKPIPPLAQVHKSTFRLSFAEPLAIIPDSLVSICLRQLNPKIVQQYFVSVIDTTSLEVVYAFEINHLDQKYIPCLGRNLPKSNYWIDINIDPAYINNLSTSRYRYSIVLISFIFLGLISLYLRYLSKRSKSKGGSTKEIQILQETNRIVLGSSSIQLTHKEMQIFQLLYHNKGQLVPRKQLMQEVWLKDGIITGRSLDVYISRLRKKLKIFATTKILNQHGKGYILKFK